MMARREAAEASVGLVADVLGQALSIGRASGGQAVVTVWVVGEPLSPEESQRVHDALCARFGAVFAGSVAFGCG